MPGSRPQATLGARIALRRRELRLTVIDAARRAGVSHKTWRYWERDARRPEDVNHRLIEEFCEWEPGSVDAVLHGREPVRRDLASVTELHPGVAHAPPDDELIRELRAMDLPEHFLNNLIAAYWSEKVHADTQRQHRYLGLAREASG